MRIYDLILKKRNGIALTKEEIYYFVNAYTEGAIPDYQASALLMAIYFQNMNTEETVSLTEAMMNSGDIIDLSGIKGTVVDKHSTGGVGDKTTIALGPIVASCGVPVAKMSGRGLGYTGGTIDKLEAIPGFSVNMTKETFINNVNSIKLAITGQTVNLAPADKKLYSLRDVTATVDNISLIASSIMSKKLATGADAIVLDVKAGSGAFMKKVNDAFILAKKMVDIGCNMGRNTVAIITEMSQPLGYAIGNTLEVQEAIQLLKNKGPKDLKNLCITLGSHMLMLSGKADTEEIGRKMIRDAIESGKAFLMLKKLVEQQGGDVSYIEDPSLLPRAKYVFPFKSNKMGYIHNVRADIIGSSGLILGTGRDTKDSQIDLSVGIVLEKKVGDYVEKGEVLAYIHYNDETKKNMCISKLESAYNILDSKCKSSPLILGIVTKDNIIEL